MVNLCKRILLALKSVEDRLRVLESNHIYTSEGNLNLDPLKDLIEELPCDTIENLQAFDNAIINIPRGQEIFVRCSIKKIFDF